MCYTVRQMRDLPLNITLKEDFVMILLLIIFFKYHDICMNLRTLNRRLREYGLRRRNKAHLEHETVVTRKLNMLEG